MSTIKPRVTVTLEPRAHEVLSRLSVAIGDSMSKIIAGFVDLAIPSLERLVVVLERAKTAPQEVRAGMAAALDRADAQLIPALLDSVGQADLWLDQMSELSKETRGAAGAAGRGARRLGVLPTPGPVTRGSGRPEKAQKQARRRVSRG